MKWATRQDCHIDRTACAWLIRRFVDSAAEFVFVADPADIPGDATPFDVPGAEFSHHAGMSTFEVMARHYRIDDQGVRALGRIVHEADIEDELYDAPEAVGVNAIVRGLGQLLSDDQALINATMPIFDALRLRGATTET
jgi:hypothetical protein